MSQSLERFSEIFINALQEFIELLEVVYPSHKALSADNVEYLLDLGDKFQIQVS